MKVTLEQLVGSVEALKRLFEEPLPIKTTFKLKKVTQEILNNLKIHDESKEELLKKYGTIKGEGYEIPSDKQEEANKEYTELLATSLTLDCSPFSTTVLGEAKISQNDLNILDWLITE